jgi:anti-sigma regulatory factor (Ser/Thr protein kinase)
MLGVSMNAQGEVVRRRRWPASLKHVSDARSFVGESVAAWTIGASSEDVCLVTSELVANAVGHARTPFTVGVSWTGKIVLIEVTDGSKVFSLRRHHMSGPPGGLGLVLVQAVSLRWGCDLTREGKTVWAVLRAPGGTNSRPVRTLQMAQ